MSSVSHLACFVEPQKLYSLSGFKKLLGITDSTLRAARRNGLIVHYAHKHGYVFGADWIEYVRSQAPKQSGNSPTLPSLNSECGTSLDSTTSSEEHCDGKA